MSKLFTDRAKSKLACCMIDLCVLLVSRHYNRVTILHVRNHDSFRVCLHHFGLDIVFLILHIGGYGIVGCLDIRLVWIDASLDYKNIGLGLIIAIFVLMMLAVSLFAAAPDAEADR